MIKRFAVLLTLVLSWHDAVFAQGGAVIERPAAVATRTHAEIRVDGVLDEPDWQLAAPIDNFRLIFVREGQPPSERTEVRVLFDDVHIYFGIWCGNEGAGPVRSSLAPRDQILDDDYIAVHLDTYLDRRRAYIFGVNAHGVQLDGILDGQEPDFSWDAVWRAETRRADDGWWAEIAVPFRAMRFPERGEGVWGLWMRREITKNDEVCSWPLWRQAEQGDIMLQAADLTGLEAATGGGGLEVEPYVASVRSETRTVQPAPVTSWSGETDGDIGGDLKYALTSTLSANLTYNPDFSQVEADALQIDVNQRFPLFYPEKRPFFLEGAEIFSTPFDLVYTRRIADPDYGGKITGQQGRVRLGVIAAHDEGGGSMSGVGAGGGFGRISRPGFVGILRSTVNIGDQHDVGLLVTHRDGERRTDVDFPFGPPPVSMVDRTRNSVVAGDARFRLGQSLFLSGQIAASSTTIDSMGNIATGQGQLEDVAYHARLRYADGVRTAAVYQNYLGPEFRAETGFLSRVDIRETGIQSNFIARPENAWLRSWQPILNGYAIHDHDGGLQEWWVSPMIDWVFQKNTSAHTMYVREMERWRGRNYDKNRYIFVFENTLWRPFTGDFFTEVGDGIYYGDTDSTSYLGWSEYYDVDATFRPSPRLTAELTASRSRFSRKFAGEEVFDVWVMGVNATYQFTRELYARVYPQYDTGRDHLDADLLLGYVVSPGTVFYVGMNGDFDEANGSHHNTQRTYFFKASYRFVR